MTDGDVSDPILQDGAVEAVVVQRDAACGAVGPRAHPCHGDADRAGAPAGSPCYDMPCRLGGLCDVEISGYGASSR